ncbi:MAG: hypothetical protein PHG54_01215 [Smithellaceae bacterium]|nr:hypothetical protein [Syntrophaceae bacterium]MDD4240026.1 hypothetical protein [Smithellaceae bacterium]NLX50470.1 hypothetical protein [Deltaproteobacteria bacterium]
MFVNFFYTLRDKGIPVTPTSFLRLQKALGMGLVTSLEDFYSAARSLLVKSERYFDTYDQVFAVAFRGMPEEEPTDAELSDLVKAMLSDWLKDPGDVARALGLSEEEVKKMTPEELVQHFLKRLKEQTEAHHGGNKWIGTHGTSPTGHSGNHPGGMRVGGESRNKSAIKVALERRYRDYSQTGPITASQMGEALKRLKHLQPAGPKDIVNVEETIRQTLRNAGEIEIVFDRRLADRLKVKLLIDNGGWSMDPYVHIVQVLFHYAQFQFKELEIYYFHNTIYSKVWLDPHRYKRPVPLDELMRSDPDTRLIIVGDASMAPYELVDPRGAIYVGQNEARPSLDYLKFLAGTFRHSVWLNPVDRDSWFYTWSVKQIAGLFPMFELSLDGLEKAVHHLMSRN